MLSSGSRRNNPKTVDRIVPAPAHNSALPRPARAATAPQVALPAAIGVVGLLDLKVIAPTGELDAVVAELLGFAGHLLQRQIGPLTGEESDRTCHVRTFLGG